MKIKHCLAEFRADFNFQESSPIGERISLLLHKAFETYTDAELRLLIAQRLALGSVLPIALGRLAKSALVQAEFYDGDLFVAVLEVPASYWKTDPDNYYDLVGLVSATESTLKGILPKIERFHEITKKIEMDGVSTP